MYRWALTESTAPASEPVTTAEAKAHMYVTVSDDDTMIDGMVAAARGLVERMTNRSLINTTWVLRANRFPIELGCIELPRSPLSSVTSIQYTDSDGSNQTWSASNYQVDTYAATPAIKPAYGETWPTTRADTYNAVTVTFVAGYGATASDVPEAFKLAIKLIVDHWYNNRGAVNIGTISKEMELTIDALLTPYRQAVFG